MFLSKSSFKKSEDCASAILMRYEISKAPVPVEEIIEKEGLKIVEYNLGEDISGVLIINDSLGTIGINPKDNYFRQRFSMAHELGHYLLHKQSNELFVDKDFIVKYRHTNRNYSVSEKRQEQEANAFAAALLMPADYIEAEMENDELSELAEIELISQLANKFKVSEAAMSYRFANLNTYI